MNLKQLLLEKSCILKKIIIRYPHYSIKFLTFMKIDVILFTYLIF